MTDRRDNDIPGDEGHGHAVEGGLDAREPAELQEIGDPELKSLGRILERLLSVEVRKIAHYQGPLPPPEWARNYEDILPGAFNRILEGTEEERRHRHKVNEHRMSTASSLHHHHIIQGYFGQVAAFTIAIVAIGGGIGLLALGQNIAGLGSVITALLGIVAVFIAGKILEGRKTDKEPSNEDAPTE